MPKKCKTPKNGECGENQALRLTIWYVLRNKEEIFVLYCPSPQSPMLAEEIQEVAAGTDGKGWPAAARCCKSGQGRMNAVLMCGRRAGTGFRDVLDFLLLRRLSEALAAVGYRSWRRVLYPPACQGDIWVNRVQQCHWLILLARFCPLARWVRPELRCGFPPRQSQSLPDEAQFGLRWSHWAEWDI